MNHKAAVGARVRLLRTASGASQAELAERLGVASGAVSMLENGRLALDQALLDGLSRVLDCSPGFLQDAGDEPLSTRPWLRAYADASKRAVDRMVADSVVAAEAVERARLQRMPDLLPLFDGDLNDDDAIEQFAALVRATAGLKPDDVVGNAVRTAEKLGCVVLPMDGELGRHLGLSLRVDGIPVIRVSRPSEDPEHDIPGDRQRFTVAHELGHLVLHHASPPPDSPAEAARFERQAHRFASAFLAPAEPVLADLNRLGGRVTLTNLARLKETWGFAIKAFVMRFQALGIIDDDHARSLYKQISARRWNKNEPVPVDNERAIWLAKAISKSEKSAPEPVAAAAAKLGLGRPYLDRWLDWSPVPAERQETASVVSLPQRPRSRPAASGETGVVTPLPLLRR